MVDCCWLSIILLRRFIEADTPLILLFDQIQAKMSPRRRITRRRTARKTTVRKRIVRKARVVRANNSSIEIHS
jgi:hypothetical protein